jgi:hypothetical protein
MAAARGESAFPFLQTAVANVSGQASGWRIGDALLHSSKRRRTARKTQPIIPFRIPSPPHFGHAPIRTLWRRWLPSGRDPILTVNGQGFAYN